MREAGSGPPLGRSGSHRPRVRQPRLALNLQRDSADEHAMTSSRRSFDERGFTLIEIMVAALVLVLGTLGMVALIDGANATTTSTKAREQGVNLQREIIEAARSVPYAQLMPTSIVSKVQATSGLED